MGLDDGGAYAQADTHVPPVGIALAGRGAKIPGEQVVQPVRMDAAAVVPDGEVCFGALGMDFQLQLGHARCMDDGVLQQIRQNLLDEHRVHGDGQEVLGDGDIHPLLLAAFAELDQHRVDELLQHRFALVEISR